MIRRQEFRQEIKKLKSLVATNRGKTFTQFRNVLDSTYERISNRKDKSYNEEFSLEELLKAKTIKKMALKLERNRVIVFEFIEHENTPLNIVFFYNEFVGRTQNGVEIYKLKEIKE